MPSFYEEPRFYDARVSRYVSQPQSVAALIASAAECLRAAAQRRDSSTSRSRRTAAGIAAALDPP